MSYITQEHLAFLSAAVKEFQGDSTLHTYRDEDLGLIALRRGPDRDSIHIFQLGPEIAFFEGQLSPDSKVRFEVVDFAIQMERQLKRNDSKLANDWKGELNPYLRDLLSGTVKRLEEVLSKKSNLSRNEVTKLTADIANYAMMIYTNEGAK